VAPAAAKKLKKKIMATEDNNNNNDSSSACPAAVATAYLVMRGAALGCVGAAMDGAQVSAMQHTYRREVGAKTAKFSVQLGKKRGDACELDLPEEADGAGVEELLSAIETAANRLIAEGHPITCVTVPREEVEPRFGSGVLDASHQQKKKKKKPRKDGQEEEEPPPPPVVVARVNDCVVAVPPGTPYATTAAIERIIVQRASNSESRGVAGLSGVQAGKKARKAEIALKFLVVEKDEGPAGAGELALPAASSDGAVVDWDLKPLQEAKIRYPEGAALREKQLAAAAADDEKAQPVVAATVSNDDVDNTMKEEEEDEEMVVNIEEVRGKIDYNKLVKKFGSKLIDPATMQLLHDETVGKGRVPVLHRFLRRGMFFSHRDLDTLLEGVRSGKPVYLYTGRGPSSGSMHLGHLIPFLFTKWLQDALDAPLVIQMTDDEKFIFKGTYDRETGDNLDHFSKLTMENARDIIACGFDYNKTFLFSDLEYVGRMYPNIVRIWKAVTTNQVSNIFGFDGSANIGKIAFPAVQAAPSFASSFPEVLQADRTSEHLCLIPCAIDQDPYFRMTRDVASKLVIGDRHKLGGKPALIHSKFFPPLQGATGKMSSSDENSAIFLTDTAEDIRRKIKQYAFSGGRVNMKQQQELGADLEVDVSYQWLRFFLEDDEELEKIANDYGSGTGKYWCTENVKGRLTEILQELVAQHQERRAKITDEEVRKWMKERSIV
jgi:tryptophanyl-tRNA synthetase